MKWRDMSKECCVEYCEMPKVACTSIKAALLEADGILLPTEVGVHMNRHFKDVNESGMEPNGSFTFVREPIGRCLSAYYSKLRTDQAKRLRNGCPLLTTATFTEWVNWILTIQPFRTDKHWAPQIFRFREIEKRLDFIGRFENIDTDWTLLQERYGLPDLRRMNVSIREPKAVVMSHDVDRLIGFYQPDYELFGYDPNIAFGHVT